MIIAIDGPAAAGKGTLARRLAAALGLPCLDTGLLYRAVGRRVLDIGADPMDAQAATAAALALADADLQRPDLRGPEADRAASAVAAIPEVRAALLAYQRSYGGIKGAVLDGRDIGTVVFPEADIKLFVTASLAARAARRHAELTAEGKTTTLHEVEAELAARDAADANRKAAPLRPAADATLFDTTAMDADAAFNQVLGLIKARASDRNLLR